MARCEFTDPHEHAGVSFMTDDKRARCVVCEYDVALAESAEYREQHQKLPHGYAHVQCAVAWRKCEETNKRTAPQSVNHPSHYGGDTTYEAIKVIEAWSLGFCLGNAVKYICRSGKKPGAETLEDLKKARWYVDREIARLESGTKPAKPAPRRLDLVNTKWRCMKDDTEAVVLAADADGLLMETTHPNVLKGAHWRSSVDELEHAWNRLDYVSDKGARMDKP